jgi:RNA polymerase sigma factor (sigma-70 family)
MVGAPSGYNPTPVSDADARLQELLDSYGALLRSTVRKLCPTTLGVSAEEIEQEARIRLWNALRRERNITDPASYLYRIAATAAIDAVRRVRARREVSIEEADTAIEPAAPKPPVVSRERSPEALAADQQVAAGVAAALAGLPDARRRAVGLHLRGFTSAEIAALLGWTEPKARNLVYRGLTDLRAALRDAGIDETALRLGSGQEFS